MLFIGFSPFGFTVGECDAVAQCVRNIWGSPRSFFKDLTAFRVLESDFVS